jgi:hypothetical protein
MQLFGMVGFAEGLWSQMIAELWLGTYLVAALGLFAVVRQSRALAAAALVVTVAVALFYCPWQAFFAASNDDPDWQSLLSAWRTAATGWVVVSVAAGANMLSLVVWHSRRSREQPDAKPNRALQQTGHATDGSPSSYVNPA